MSLTLSSYLYSYVSTDFTHCFGVNIQAQASVAWVNEFNHQLMSLIINN